MASGTTPRWVKCLSTGEIFKSAKEAAKKYNAKADAIRNCCNGRIQTSCGGLYWAYVSNVEYERTEKIKIARELCYGDEVINRLEKATTSGELNRIMKSARLGKE